MTRKVLPDRRLAITTNVKWNQLGGPDHKLIVTFGFDDEKILKEVFVAGFRAEGTFCALVNDACIMMSRLLQHGERIEDLADSLHENVPEGASSGAPASMLGAIAKCGIQVQRDIKEGKTSC